MQLRDVLRHTEALLPTVLQVGTSAERQLADYVRGQKRLSSWERQLLGDVLYVYLRRKQTLELALADAPAALGHWSAISLLTVQLAGRMDAAWLQALPPEQSAWLHRQAEHLAASSASADMPEWIAQAVAALLPPAGEKSGQMSSQEPDWAAAFLQAAPVTLRVNPMQGKPKAALAALQAAGITAAACRYAPSGLVLEGRPRLTQLPLFASGGLELQDEGSQLIALATGAKRQDVVVDYCAGAGGKTLAIASQMRGQGRVYALDTSASRLRRLEPRQARAKLENIYPMTIAADGADERLRRLAGKADVVLVDAPCSGLGTLRRQPDLKWRRRADEIADLAALQLDILRQAAQLVRQGGRLLYATCSLLPAENEAVVAAFDALGLDFVPLAVSACLAKAGVAEAESLCVPAPDPAADYLRTWPHLHGMDGFFLAAWQRR